MEARRVEAWDLAGLVGEGGLRSQEREARLILIRHLQEAVLRPTVAGCVLQEAQRSVSPFFWKRCSALRRQGRLLR